MCNKSNYLFTSESVSCGHPDKICDQISDAILDEFLMQDGESKVAVECFITNNMLVIGGEAHSNATVDIIGTAKRVIEEIGYDGTNGFNPESAVFINTLHEQSSDIRMGVVREEEKWQGAGDQGIMFGYATNETLAFLPAPIALANSTMYIYDGLRKEGVLPYCNPDAKCQYTIEYVNGKPNKIKTILISMQHKEIVHNNDYLLSKVEEVIIPTVIKQNPDLAYLFKDNDYQILVNPTGRFVIGGPEGDTGLTGRKIIVDTYGGKCPHGGGAFSGKDPSKVDRSAAYAARYIAKNLVAAGVSPEITVQLSYAIGMAEPLSIYVDTHGKGNYSNERIINVIKKVFPLKPYDIIEQLELKQPIYLKTATYGHFGRKAFRWEMLDKVDEIVENI